MGWDWLVGEHFTISGALGVLCPTSFFVFYFLFFWFELPLSGEFWGVGSPESCFMVAGRDVHLLDAL